MFCARCGRNVPEGARFCPNCGAAVTVVTVLPAESPFAPPEPTSPVASGEARNPYAAPAATEMGATAPGAAVTGTSPVPPWSAPSTETPPWSTPPAETPPWSVPPVTAAPVVAPVYGGFWRRLGALVIDGILLNILMSPLYLSWVWPTMLAASANTRPEDMDPERAFAIMGTFFGFAVVAGLIEALYFALLEGSSQQASLGKLALGLKLTDLEGRRIGFGKALLRRLARVITGFTFFIGYLMMLWTRRRQTLHDLMIGTLVLRR